MTRKSLLIFLVLGVLLFFLTPVAVLADPVSPVNTMDSVLQQSENEVAIYFYWGESCPHCARAKPVLEALANQNPSVKLYEFEVYYSEENQQIFTDMAEAYGFQPRYVPTIIIGDKYWEGYSDELSQEFTAEVDRCLNEGCEDKGAVVIEGKGLVPFSGTVVAPPVEPTPIGPEQVEVEVDQDENTTKLPLFGEVDFSKIGIFLSTALIAFVDGFNPCSVWVLSMLLAITLHTGSRKKVLVIGLVFITVTALIYALFIAGLFTVLNVADSMKGIRWVVALVALFFGLVNIKDYFFYKEGVSFTISDEKKPGIFQRMRKVMDAGDSWWGLIAGTVVLAAGVSLVEFSCTAGFPVIWTKLVQEQQVTTATFLVLLLLYMLIYQLDELGIFLVATFTLKSSKMEEKHGRILKLIGGVLMLTLAIVMLVNPALMSDIGKSLVIFAIAFGVTILILLLHRAVLPRLGIHFGTEFSRTPKTKNRRRTRR